MNESPTQLQPGSSCSLCSMPGQIVACTPDFALIEMPGNGFVVFHATSQPQAVMTIALPGWCFGPLTVNTIKRETLELFGLDPQHACLVKTARPQPLGAPVSQSFETSAHTQSFIPPPVAAADTAPFAPSAGQNPNTAIIPALLDRLRPDEGEELYSVPRRYDLASMFAISVAYAILFAILRALSTPPVVTMLFGVFFAVIGAAQALLFGGKSPREASVVAGGATAALFTLLASLPYNSLGFSIILAIGSLLWGPLAGYVAGTMVGGIWLIADMLRQRWER